MGRKYFGLAVFVAVWLIMLSVPTLRVMLPLPVSSDFNFNPGIAARYPNDPRVQAAAEQRSGLNIEPYPQTAPIRELVGNYDNLINRFPKESWLIAARLKWTVLKGVTGRVAGDLEKGSPARQISYTPQQLAQAIALCEKGRQMEADNSFYDWMLAYFLFAARRDGEALNTLHEGAQKPRYDDHARQQAEARIGTAALNHPLSSDAKLAIWSTSQFPHFAAQRHITRLAVWAAVEAERAGDHARALQIYGDVARLGGRMREANYTIIGALVGGAIQHISWAGERRLTDAERKAGRAQRSLFTTLRVARFAEYAAAHGRADLAQEARREGESYIRFQGSARRYVEHIGTILDPLSGKTVLLRGAGAALLSQL